MSEESGEEGRGVEVSVVSGVVGSVVCEVSECKRLSKVGELVGWELSGEEGEEEVSGEVGGEEWAEDEVSGSGEEGKEWLGHR